MLNTYLLPSDWPPEGADPPTGADASGNHAAAVAKINELYPPDMLNPAYYRDIILNVQPALADQGVFVTQTDLMSAIDEVVATRWPDGQPPMWRLDPVA